MIEHRGTPGRARLLLVLALLAGLVGMHQLVTPGAHHGSHQAVPVAHATQPDPGTGHGVGHDAGHEDPGGHTTVLEHLCLAVLVALGTLLAVAVVALLSAPTRRPGAARGPTPVLAGRAPVPVPRRLAALQVLRL